MTCSDKDYELKMVHQNSGMFYKSIVYDRHFTGLGDSFDKGNRMASIFLKPENELKRILLQKHHGVFVIAPSIQVAFFDLYFLEKACQT